MQAANPLQNSTLKLISLQHSCHEKAMLGDAEHCRPVPDEITKKPAVTRA